MEARPRRLLGEVLLAMGALDETGLAIALTEQERTGRLLGEVVVSLGLVGSAVVSRAIAEQMREPRDAFEAVSLAIPGISSSGQRIEAEAEVVHESGNSKSVATAEPSDEDKPTVHLIHSGGLALLLLRYQRVR